MNDFFKYFALKNYFRSSKYDDEYRGSTHPETVVKFWYISLFLHGLAFCCNCTLFWIFNWLPTLIESISTTEHCNCFVLQTQSQFSKKIYNDPFFATTEKLLFWVFPLPHTIRSFSVHKHSHPLARMGRAYKFLRLGARSKFHSRWCADVPFELDWQYPGWFCQPTSVWARRTGSTRWRNEREKLIETGGVGKGQRTTWDRFDGTIRFVNYKVVVRQAKKNGSSNVWQLCTVFHL